MKYVALLRGINVGTTKRIEMKALVALFERSGYTDVSTYINSGNIFFESPKKTSQLRKEIEKSLMTEFSIEIPVIVKTAEELRQIVQAIPASWVNDETQKTDVAFLFEDADNPLIIEELPVNRAFVDIRYINGAIFWNVQRQFYNKSRLNKLISHPAYHKMTVRNINTARYLAERQT
jgi:uncharacterized protein (DUF1697 family)